MPASRQRRQRLAAALHRQSILHACNRWKNAINCLMASPMSGCSAPDNGALICHQTRNNATITKHHISKLQAREATAGGCSAPPANPPRLQLLKNAQNMSGCYAPDSTNTPHIQNTWLLCTRFINITRL